MSGPRRGMLAILVPDWCEFRAPLDSPQFMSPVFSAFGLALRFHAPLPGTGATTGRLDATVRLAVGEPGELSAVWTGASGPPHWEADLTDGSRVSLVPGRGGDWLLQTPTAAFCFSADLHTVLCAPDRPADAEWKRTLLDTVLICLSLLRGHQLLHAAAVELGGKGVAILAPTGASLAVELCRRRGSLISDDVIALECGACGVLAHPGPAVVNLPAKHASLIPELGRLIASVPSEDELWIDVDRAASGPALNTVYLLGGSTASGASLGEAAGTVVDLLPEALALHSDPDSTRARFLFYSDVVDRVAVRPLRRGPGASPSDLADLVEASVSRSS